MTQIHHNDAAWADIRDGYLDGHTQESLALRYNVGRSTIRDRARREGWRRRDRPPPVVPPLDLDGFAAFDDEGGMRPIVAVVADAYQRADACLRRGRLLEAQRCLAIAKGFERLLLRDDWVRDAVNEHWTGMAESLALSRSPPWPEDVADAEAARAELARERAAMTALLADEAVDPADLADALERVTRLRACLDMTQPPLPSSAGEVVSGEPPETGGATDGADPSSRPPALRACPPAELGGRSLSPPNPPAPPCNLPPLETKFLRNPPNPPNPPWKIHGPATPRAARAIVEFSGDKQTSGKPGRDLRPGRVEAPLQMNTSSPNAPRLVAPVTSTRRSPDW